MKKNRLNFKSMLAAISLGCISMLAIGQISTLPVIDGNGSDAIWATAPTFTLDSVINNANITGPSDCSGSFKVLWSTDSLYLLFNISDDSLDNTNSGDNQYLNDNVVVYIDAFNLKTHTYTKNTQVYYEIYWDDISSVKGRKGPDWAVPGGINHVNVITNHVGYVTEAAIAWSEFGLNAFAGSIVGLDVKLADNDNDGTGRGLLAWNDNSDNGWQFPDVFGQIYLNRDGTVKGLYTDSITPITVDGKGDDAQWLNAETWDITRYVNGGSHKITGPSDFSGIAKFLWTADSLYAFYSIKDDVLDSIDANAYATDNATIAIDLNNTKSALYDLSDSTAQHFWEIYWYNLAPSGKMGPINIKKIIDAGTGYTLEAAIPFAASKFVPVLGDTIGIDIKLNDADGTGRDQLSYNDITDNIWQYPRVMGSAKLLDNGKVKSLRMPMTPALTATADSNDIVLTWPAAIDAAQYIVYKGGVSLGTISALTYTDAGLADGTYSYSLKAISADGMISSMSAVKSATVNTVPPSVEITSASATIGGEFAITITFSKKVTGFTDADLTITNGTAKSAALSSANDIVFTDTIIPTAAGDVIIDIAAGVCTDLNTAPNTAGSLTVSYVGVENTSIGSLSLYPNPIDGVLNYSITGYSGSVEFRVYNMVGSMVYQNTFNNSNGAIDMTSLESGAYILKVRTDNSEFINKLIVK